MKRYGMEHRMIRYLQNGAKMHVRYNGDPGVFQRKLQCYLRLNDPPVAASTIGHAAIEAAAVCHRAVIRWTITRS